MKVPFLNWWAHVSWLHKGERMIGHEFEVVEYAIFHHYRFWFFEISFNDWGCD